MHVELCFSLDRLLIIQHCSFLPNDDLKTHTFSELLCTIRNQTGT